MTSKLRDRRGAKVAGPKRIAQAWIEPVADDPEAVSAFAVAKRALGATGLRSLRRVRLIEIEGVLPGADELAATLHASTRFYNPNKERCRLRTQDVDPAPIASDERAVLIFDRGGERREGAERWWKRVTGGAVRVREGAAWIAAATDPARSDAELDALVEVRDARHGLLCNSNAQEFRKGGDGIPLGWFVTKAGTRRRTR